MEIALTYGCPESVDRETLVEYVHHNRNLNARRISTMGEAFFYQRNWQIDIWSGRTIERFNIEQEQRIVNNSELITTIKDELTRDIVDNNADHEERISQNTDRIDSVKAEMESQILEIGNKMEEQEGRTATMIGGIFSKLSGVLVREISESVRAVEAREAEQDGEIAEIVENNVQQDEKIKELENALADFKKEVLAIIAKQNTKIEEQEARISLQDTTIALQNEKIEAQDEKILSQYEEIISRDDKILKQNEMVLDQNERLAALHERLLAQNETIAKQKEQILEKDEIISKQNETILERGENIENFKNKLGGILDGNISRISLFIA